MYVIEYHCDACGAVESIKAVTGTWGSVMSRPLRWKIMDDGHVLLCEDCGHRAIEAMWQAIQPGALRRALADETGALHFGDEPVDSPWRLTEADIQLRVARF